MNISRRILLLILIIISLSTFANVLLNQYQSEALHNESEIILVKTLINTLRESMVQDVIDENKLRVTDQLRKIRLKNNSIEFIYVTDTRHRIFAHSYEKGFPEYLLYETSNKKNNSGVNLVHKYQTKRGLIFDYKDALIDGLGSHLHIGINQTKINARLDKNNQVTFSISIILTVAVMLLAYLWSRSITRPIHDFTSLIENYGSGKSAEFSRVGNKIPELNMLAHAFEVATSDRQKALSELRESKEDLAITLNCIGDAVIATDENGFVTKMNPVAEKLTGWSIDAAQGKLIKTIFPIIDATTREPIANPVDKVLKTGEIVYLSNHTTLISKDGTEYQIADSAAPIRDNDRILGMVLVFNDITEQYRLREAANKSRNELKAIMDHSPAIIYVKDLEGRFVFINNQFNNIFKTENKTVVEKTAYDILPQEIADSMTLNDQDVITTKQALESDEKFHLKETVHSFNSVRFPLYNSENNIYAICCISTDITERKMHEEQLRRSQKMDALGMLTGGIAHDFNNMLGIILGYSDLLLLELEDQPKLENYAQQILTAVQRGTSFTRKLLDFSRHETDEKTKININTLLNDEKQMLEKSLTSRIKLVYDLTDDLWNVYLDHAELEDIILNLSINAMHAIEGTGQLTVQTYNETITSQASRLLQIDQGQYAMLSFIDTGCGMNEETRDKMFDPFFTTKGDKGTGLGLSQVYGFVQRSNGFIKVYSEINHGTRIDLYFPKYNEADNNQPQIDNPDDRVLHGNEKILVVDDESALRELSSAILKQNGYTVYTADSGKQALEVLGNTPVDVVISDVIMPEMDGYELSSMIQAKYPDVKIQLVSGYTDERHANLVDEELHINLLHKPFKRDELLLSIRKLLDS